MRTTINIPEKLLKEAQKAAKTKTKTDTFIKGLEELIRKSKVEGLIALQGRLKLNIDVDASRERK